MTKTCISRCLLECEVRPSMGHMTNSSSELTHYSFVTGLWPTPGVWPASEANCYSKVKPYKFRTSYLVLWNRDVKAFEVSSNHIHGIFQWQIRMRRKRKFAKGEERDERNRGRWQRIGEKGKERARSKRSHEFGGKKVKVKVHDSDLKWVSLDATSLLSQRQLWLWTRIRCFFALFRSTRTSYRAFNFRPVHPSTLPRQFFLSS